MLDACGRTRIWNEWFESWCGFSGQSMYFLQLLGGNRLFDDGPRWQFAQQQVGTWRATMRNGCFMANATPMRRCVRPVKRRSQVGTLKGEYVNRELEELEHFRGIILFVCRERIRIVEHTVLYFRSV